MNLTRIYPDISIFPEKVLPYLADAELFDSSCHSDATVIYSSKGYFIKTAPKYSLSREYEAANILYDASLGVRVCGYISGEKDHLITEKAPGSDLTHYTEDPEYVCGVLLSAMKKLHSTEPVYSMVSKAQTVYENAAAAGSENRNIREIDEFFGIKSYEDAIKTISLNRGILKRDTFIHGDFCLPNVLTDEAGTITVIDAAYSGTGDRHIDLYWAAWSLWFNTGDMKWAERFLSMYGRQNISFEKLRYIASAEIIL